MASLLFDNTDKYSVAQLPGIETGYAQHVLFSSATVSYVSVRLVTSLEVFSKISSASCLSKAKGKGGCPLKTISTK